MYHNQKFIVNVWDPKTRFNTFGAGIIFFNFSTLCI